VSRATTKAAEAATQLHAALQRHLSVKTISSHLVRRVACADGLEVSIQASEYNYCSPRENRGPWDSVELGFPSEAPNPTIMQRAENPSEPTQTVYGYVPIEDVVDWLLEHGGCPEIEAAVLS
jgi:hypothetical protein